MDPRRKRKIVGDWQKEFLLLRTLTPSILAVKLDFVLLCFSISSDGWIGESYDFTLQMFPLWMKEGKMLQLPLLSFGRTKDVYTDFHESRYMESVEDIRSRFGKILTGNISLTEFWWCIKYAETDRVFQATKHNPASWWPIFYLELATALYLNDRKMNNLIWRQIEFETTYWNKERSEEYFRQSLDDWKKKLRENFSDRTAFMENIRRNKELSKIKRLNDAHIYMDDFNYSKAFRPVNMWERLHWMFFKR